MTGLSIRQWLYTSTKVNRGAKEILRRFDLSRPDDHFLIFGNYRGGTTWLAETLSNKTQYPLLWEPDNPEQLNVLAELNFCWEQIIPHDASWFDAGNAFEKILSKKVLNNWLCRNNKPVDFLGKNEMIVKFVRGNGFAVWLVNNVRPKNYPVVILRHPIAVAASALSHGAWDHLTPKIGIPNGRYQEFYEKHKDLFSSIDTIAERHVAMWCLQNVNLLNYERLHDDFVVVFYESLLQNPVENINKILASWGLEKRDLDVARLTQPSSTTLGKNTALHADEQITKWESIFSKREISKMLYIMEYFGIEVYDRDPTPKKCALVLGAK